MKAGMGPSAELFNQANCGGTVGCRGVVSQRFPATDHKHPDHANKDAFGQFTRRPLWVISPRL